MKKYIIVLCSCVCVDESARNRTLYISMTFFYNIMFNINNDAQSKQTICAYLVSVYTFFYHIRLFVVISETMLCLFVLNLQFAYADFPLYEIHCGFFLSRFVDRFGGERGKERREKLLVQPLELDSIFAPNHKSRLSCIYI